MTRRIYFGLRLAAARGRPDGQQGTGHGAHQVEFDAAVLHVRRVKNGTPSTHPLLGDEMRALRRLNRESQPSPFDYPPCQKAASFSIDQTLESLQQGGR